MKKLIYSLALILTFGLISCGSTKETASTSENDKTAPPAKEESAKSNDQAADMDSQPAKNERTGQISGNDIVVRATKSLEGKLSLNEGQSKDIARMLSQSFTESGKKLEEMYPAEQAKSISRDIIKAAQSGISAILDDTQKMKFEQFLNK